MDEQFEQGNTGDYERGMAGILTKVNSAEGLEKFAPQIEKLMKEMNKGTEYPLWMQIAMPKIVNRLENSKRSNIKDQINAIGMGLKFEQMLKKERSLGELVEPETERVQHWTPEQGERSPTTIEKTGRLFPKGKVTGTEMPQVKSFIEMFKKEEEPKEIKEGVSPEGKNIFGLVGKKTGKTTPVTGIAPKGKEEKPLSDIGKLSFDIYGKNLQDLSKEENDALINLHNTFTGKDKNKLDFHIQYDVNGKGLGVFVDKEKAKIHSIVPLPGVAKTKEGESTTNTEYQRKYARGYELIKNSFFKLDPLGNAISMIEGKSEGEYLGTMNRFKENIDKGMDEIQSATQALKVSKAPKNPSIIPKKEGRYGWEGHEWNWTKKGGWELTK